MELCCGCGCQLHRFKNRAPLRAAETLSQNAASARWVGNTARVSHFTETPYPLLWAQRFGTGQDWPEATDGRVRQIARDGRGKRGGSRRWKRPLVGGGSLRQLAPEAGPETSLGRTGTRPQTAAWRALKRVGKAPLKSSGNRRGNVPGLAMRTRRTADRKESERRLGCASEVPPRPRRNAGRSPPPQARGN